MCEVNSTVKKLLSVTLLALLVSLPAWADFPTVAATNTSNATEVTSHAISLPADILSGHLLIVLLGLADNRTTTWPGGWTEMWSVSSAGAVVFEGYYRIADGTEGATITVTTNFGTTSGHNSYRITGYADTPEDGTPATGSGTTPDPPSLTPSWGAEDTLWLACMMHDVADITGFPTNYTDGIESSAGSSSAITGSARRELNATSENPGTFTVSLSFDWIANTIAIRPAAAAASPRRRMIIID